MNIESELERALRRTTPDPGFATRVMRRIEASGRPVTGRTPKSRSWRAAAAGLILTAIAGGWAAQRAVERRQGERARDEVLLALRIAGSKVHTAQQHVRELGSR